MTTAALPAPANVGARGTTMRAPHADWRDLVTLKWLALATLVVALDALLARSGPWDALIITRHLRLDPPALYVVHRVGVATATVVGMMVVVAWIAARQPRRSASLYVKAVAGVLLVNALRVLFLFGQLTDYSFRIADLAPESAYPEFPPGSEFFSWANKLATLPYLGLYYGGVSACLACAYVYLRRQEQTAADLARSQLEATRSEQQATAARLAMLEAQIEPHFLFNTLANVKRLYRTDAEAGARMLDNLMRYLGEALPQMREADATIGRELALAQAYLGVQQIRMGARLRVAIDVPQFLRSVALPPMMLLTLVENAIKHGLNPLPDGGTLQITARERGDRVVITVADSGRGFTRTSGTGTGLANLRARLELTYAGGASLQLSNNLPRGVVATLDVPKHPASAVRAP